MSEIHLLGLDHFLQNQQDVSWTVAGLQSEQRQKQEFEALVRRLIREHEIGFLSEEGIFNDTCLGCRIAREVGLNYINITMPQEERDRVGILNNYEDREDTKVAAIAAFEKYMADAVNGQKAQKVLVLCGRLHIEGLGNALEKSGHTVYRYDVAGCEWFQGRPRESANGEIIGYDR